MRYDPALRNSAVNQELNARFNISQNDFYVFPYHRDRMLQAAGHFGFENAQATLQNPEDLMAIIVNNITTHLSQIPVTSGVVAGQDASLRLKVIVNRDGGLDIQTGSTPPVSLEALFPQSLDLPQHRRESKPLRLSPLTGGGLTLGPHSFIPTSPDGHQPWPIYVDTETTTPDAFTTYKTTERSVYDLARRRACITKMTAQEEVLLVNTAGEIMEGSMTAPYFRRDGRWVTPPSYAGGQLGTTRRWALEKGLCVEGTVRAVDLEDGEDIWISSGVRGFRRGKIHRRPDDLIKQP
ncbi:MAG: hypothetical protein Q9157_000432 [Trypethelium eluteriae]